MVPIIAFVISDALIRCNFSIDKCYMLFLYVMISVNVATANTEINALLYVMTLHWLF